MQLRDKIPNLFILGAPKCGTTSMAHYLGQHPEIYVCPVKEPHYFNIESGHRYYYNEADYLNLFSESTTKHRWLCEASVWYLYSEKAVDEILNFNPNAKFIVMLRNPTEMYLSLHRELLFGGAEDISSPIKAWKLQESRREGKNIPAGCTDVRMLQYGEACKLGAQLQRLVKRISSEQLKIVFLEDLKKDPDSCYLDVLGFLNIDIKSLENYDVVNLKKQRKYPWLSTLFISLNKVKNRLGIKKGFGFANKINKINVTQRTSDIEYETRILEPELRHYFNDDIALLAQLTEKDLSHWKSKN